MLCKCKRCGRDVSVPSVAGYPVREVDLLGVTSGVSAWNIVPESQPVPQTGDAITGQVSFEARWIVESARFSNSRPGQLTVDVDAVPVSSTVELRPRGEIPQDADFGRSLSQYIREVYFSDSQ